MLRHLSIHTEKTYTHWLGRCGAFLRDQKLAPHTPERHESAHGRWTNRVQVRTRFVRGARFIPIPIGRTR